eukprot:scaffold150582_cov27-Tisochrysis_lutea.AAC.1
MRIHTPARRHQRPSHRRSGITSWRTRPPPTADALPPPRVVPCHRAPHRGQLVGPTLRRHVLEQLRRQRPRRTAVPRRECPNQSADSRLLKMLQIRPQGARRAIEIALPRDSPLSCLGRASEVARLAPPDGRWTVAYTLAVQHWLVPPTMVVPTRLGWRPLPTSLSDCEPSFADEGVFATVPSVVQHAFGRWSIASYSNRSSSLSFSSSRS